MILSACITDHTDDAVEKARQYVFDHLRPLTELERQYVMFNQPEIYENVIFPQQAIPLTELGHIRGPKTLQYPTTSRLDWMHSCIVWTPPDLGGARIMVIGEGERCMRFWTPIRVVIKEFNVIAPAYKTAVASCVSYAKNKMLYLTPDELNRIRFSDPEIVYTRLDITPVKKEDQTSVQTDWEDYLNELKKEVDYDQISLVWKSDKEDQKIVFSGWTTSKNLNAWKLQTSEVMAEKKLSEHMLTPEEIEERGFKTDELFQQKIIYAPQIKVDRQPVKKTNKDLPEGGSILWK